MTNYSDALLVLLVQMVQVVLLVLVVSTAGPDLLRSVVGVMQLRAQVPQ